MHICKLPHQNEKQYSAAIERYNPSPVKLFKLLYFCKRFQFLSSPNDNLTLENFDSVIKLLCSGRFDEGFLIAEFAVSRIFHHSNVETLVYIDLTDLMFFSL